jgi:hypothetical protein
VACHSRILIGVRETNGLRMSHVGVLGAEWPCAKCHPTSGHKAPSATNTGYTMEMCVPCHFTSTKNLASCDLCHPAGKGSLVRPAWPTPFSIVHGPQWRVAHGMGDLATCKACHDQGYCARCHHMEVPHQVGYVQVHGKQVLAGTVKQNDCYVCHSGTSCQDCHGLPMPHPTGFVKNHPQITGRVGQQVCMRCHEAASCPDCHQRHIHPGIPAAILKQLREHPAR